MSIIMGKPIINKNIIFDTMKLNNYQLDFKWNGQKTSGNRLTVITSNGTTKTHDIIGISSSFHPLTYSICQELGINNGHTYKATITMLDSQGNVISNASDQFFIHAYSTPVFQIINISPIVKSTTFLAMINYDSQEGMQLQSYKFNLYKDDILVQTSPDLYLLPTENTTDYSTCSYTFNLEDKTQYVIEALGITVYGMELSVSYEIEVDIGSIGFPNIIETKPSRDGNINVNIRCVPMKYEMDNIKYTNTDEVDLTNGYVNYELVEPLENFKFKVKLRSITDLNKEVISFKDYTNTNKNIISIKPKVEYIHATTSSTSNTGLIRPTVFTYDESEYIDYIECARMKLSLCINDAEYAISDSYITLSYNPNTDRFFLNKNTNIIVEITRINGNYNITITTL